MKAYRRAVVCLCLLPLSLLAAGCTSGADTPSGKPVMNEQQPLYFASPQAATEKISELLKKEDWPALARYYDLSGTDIRRETLTSGDFFLNKERPQAVHPAVPWKYRHPFPPVYKFVSATVPDADSVVVVTVGLAIDQGGGMVQRSRAEYSLRKSPQGYQVLPK